MLTRRNFDCLVGKVGYWGICDDFSVRLLRGTKSLSSTVIANEMGTNLNNPDHALGTVWQVVPRRYDPPRGVPAASILD
jgi:hypothetical protein